MGAALNQTLSTQSSADDFGSRMSSAGFISDPALSNILTTMGISEYVKVSRIMAAAKAHVTTSGSAKRVTEKFNQFVLILYDMHLNELAEELVKKLCKYNIYKIML